LGRPAVIRLTAGNVSDIRAAGDVLAAARPLKRLIADKGYDANALRNELRANGVQPVIPGRINRKRTIRYDEKRYRDRWRIEAAFCRLKDFRRVATRGACPRASEAGPGGQARSKLLVCHSTRRNHRLLDLNESRP
jgi:transposase